MRKQSLKFPKDMTTDELDEAIRSLIKEGELSLENAWEVREAAISMQKRGSSKRHKAQKKRREFSKAKKFFGEKAAKGVIVKVLKV